ncbi:MAG TPA: hypothetical protein VGQ50_03745 [Actinomycetota bacterium]|nr:hypothetical protein [Actinomycetota bacterium]
MDSAASRSPPIHAAAAAAVRSASIPVGFGTVRSPFSSIGMGRTIAETTSTTRVAPIAHSTHRQARDGGRPVGNRISTIGISPAITNVQLLIHATQSPPGSAPGFVCTVYVAYSAVPPPKRRPSAMTRNSQPIGLWGTRIARIAPVIM